MILGELGKEELTSSRHGCGPNLPIQSESGRKAPRIKISKKLALLFINGCGKREGGLDLREVLISMNLSLKNSIIFPITTSGFARQPTIYVGHGIHFL